MSDDRYNYGRIDGATWDHSVLVIPVWARGLDNDWICCFVGAGCFHLICADKSRKLFGVQAEWGAGAQLRVSARRRPGYIRIAVADDAKWGGMATVEGRKRRISCFCDARLLAESLADQGFLRRQGGAVVLWAKMTQSKKDLNHE